jgi:hypothetical protein
MARLRALTTVLSGLGETDSIPQPGIMLGVDATDRLALRLPARDKSEYARLVQYNASGQLVASASVPARPLASILGGKGNFQVAEQGDIYQFIPTTEGIEISRWSGGARP